MENKLLFSIGKKTIREKGRGFKFKCHLFVRGVIFVCDGSSAAPNLIINSKSLILVRKLSCGTAILAKMINTF